MVRRQWPPTKDLSYTHDSFARSYKAESLIVTHLLCFSAHVIAERIGMKPEAKVDPSGFNRLVELPYSLRLVDFEIAMQDVYDLFRDINGLLLDRGLNRLEETFRPAAMSGFISDLLTASLSNHARSLTANQHFNGHPDLVVKGVYPNNQIQAGSQGVEIKSTRKRGGAVDTHGARDQWLCVFVYNIDNETEPARERLPTTFTEVYLAHVGLGDFRKNPRGELGTRTATLHREGLQKLRSGWVYKAGVPLPLHHTRLSSD